MGPLVWQPKSVHSQILKCMCTKLHKLYEDGTVEILLSYFNSISFFPPILFCFALLESY